MAVGLGVCTDPDGQGSFSGMWHNGFEVSGVKTRNRDNRLVFRGFVGLEGMGLWLADGGVEKMGEGREGKKMGGGWCGVGVKMS